MFIKEATYNSLYEDASVRLGSLSGKFIPNINISKFNDECWLNINHPDIILTQKEVLQGDKIILTVGNNTHIFYSTIDGKLEYEIVFSSQPSSNIITLDLTFSDGLMFYYQPELTQWEINKGCIRSPEIVGSYAVYWNKKNNQYKTGKFCHIERPRITDFKGNTTYGTLFIDEVNKQMHITIDGVWLKNAIYPVIVDPTIGYSSIGGSNSNTEAYIMANRFSCPTTGSANPGTFYLYGSDSGGPRNWPGAVYEVGDGNISGNAKLSTSDAVISMGTTSAWYSGNVTYTGFTAGTDYFLAIAGQATVGSWNKYDTITSGYEDLQYTAGTTLPNPHGARTGTLAWELSMYIDYTAGGGGVTYPQLERGTRGLERGLYRGEL